MNGLIRTLRNFILHPSSFILPRAGAVDLDLHQQIAMLALKRFGPCSYSRLQAEVEAVRPATQAQIVNAILSMEAAGVIERLHERDTPQAQRRYVLTRRGRRIARWVPAEPRSAMAFYV
jgi:DNA-binding MarR family transcriptional regulator